MSKFNELIKGKVPVIVNFYADWALTSEDMLKDLKSFKSDFPGDIKMVRIDFDKNEAVAKKLNVIGVPAVVVFKEGKVLYRAVGEIDSLEIKEKVQ